MYPWIRHVLFMLQLRAAMPDQMTGAYKAAVLSTEHKINIGDIHVIITFVSAKQVYNGKVKPFNEKEPFH